MKTATVQIDQIVPYHRNPRNNDHAVEAVKQSIEDYGFNSPIVVDNENVIIAGHTRYRALRELGWDKVPVVKVDLTPEQATAYRIADNKTGEMSFWDDEKLLMELRELEISDMEIYFDPGELENLLSDPVVSYKDVTTEDVKKESDSLNTKYEDVTQPAKLAITCPHCLEDFELDRDYIANLMQIKE